MAIKLKLTRTGINSTGTEMYLSDATGDYHVDDNPGGWGAPNPERNTKALLIQAYLNKSTGAEEVTSKEYDPVTASSFTLETEEDGYYEVLMVTVDNADPTVEGSYGWSSSRGLTQLVEGVLVSKTIKEVYDDIDFTDSTSYKTILLARMAIYRNRKNLDLIKLRSQNLEDRDHVDEIAEADDHFKYVKSLLEGAWYLWCADSYTLAQDIVEAFNNILNE